MPGPRRHPHRRASRARPMAVPSRRARRRHHPHHHERRRPPRTCRRSRPPPARNPFSSVCLDPDCGGRLDHDVRSDGRPTPCPRCGMRCRPEIVLFGEPVDLDALWQAKREVRDCEVFWPSAPPAAPRQLPGPLRPGRGRLLQPGQRCSRHGHRLRPARGFAGRRRRSSAAGTAALTPPGRLDSRAWSQCQRTGSR